MALVSSRNLKPVIDLTRPEGNAFVLLSTAKDLCGELGLDASSVMEDMQAGDYAHLVKVFDRHFGHAFEIRVPEVLEAQLC